MKYLITGYEWKPFQDRKYLVTAFRRLLVLFIGLDTVFFPILPSTPGHHLEMEQADLAEFFNNLFNSRVKTLKYDFRNIFRNYPRGNSFQGDEGKLIVWVSWKQTPSCITVAASIQILSTWSPLCCTISYNNMLLKRFMGTCFSDWTQQILE